MEKFDLTLIKKRRKELGFSTDFMAKKMGLANSSVYWKYENGCHKFKAEMLPLLADILQCEPENFFDKLKAE